jgi:Lrp/AsnC family transcriptional regulator for asnA, asnC and gidA
VVGLSRVLASIGIFVDKSKKKDVLAALCNIENIEEIYDVTGEFDILSIVSASCLEELREILQRKIMKIKGVRSAITNIILQPHKIAKKPDASRVGAELNK